MAAAKSQKYVVPVERNVPLPDWTMPAQVAKSLRMDFRLISRLDGHTEKNGTTVSGHDMLVLLSTCQNHAATFNACAFEVHCWLRHEMYNFDRVLSALEATDWGEAISRAESAANAAKAVAEKPVENQKNLFDLKDNSSADVVLDPLHLDRARAQSFDSHFKSGTRLSTLIRHCREYLSEYKHKHDLFFERFDEIVNAMERYCSRDSYGEVFWEESIAKKGFFDRNEVGTVVPRFNALNLIEQLAWRLMEFVESALVSRDLWLVGGPKVTSKREIELDAAISAFDDRVDFANDHHYSPWVSTKLRAEIGEDPATAELPSMIGASRKCFAELKRFFDLWIPEYERNSLTPFLPDPGKAVFRGFKENVLSSHFLLFIDIINSKKSPPSVKSEMQTALRDTRHAYPTEITGNDAYLIISPTWDGILALVNLLKSRTAPYQDSSPFGGLRCSVAYGDCIVRVFDDNQKILMDLEGEPCIPVAAYLNDQAKKLLETAGLGDQENQWLVVDRKVAEIAASSTDETQLATAGFAPLGGWGKKGIVSTAFRFSSN